MEGRITPQNTDIERVVLGSLIMDFLELRPKFHLVREGYFYLDKHRYIFYAIKKLIESGQVPDLLTITQQLKKDGTLEAVGGAFEVTTMTNRIGSTFNFDEHLLVLKELYVRRELYRNSLLTNERAANESIDIFDIIDENNKRNEEIQAIIHDQSKVASFSDQINKTIELAEFRERMAKEGKISGIRTGLTELDKATYGWQNSDLIVLAARPGMGKTAFALNFAVSAALSNKKVNIHSLEMPATRLIDRLLLNVSTVDAGKYNAGVMNELDWQAIKSSAERLLKMDFKINDNANTKIDFIHGYSRIQKLRNECDLIIIDYLQLIGSSGKNSGRNREQEVSEISRACKVMAKDLNVPVILLAQLSRAVETRGGDKKPMLSDLRESGAIEQDADLIIFPYRPSYYGLKDESGADLTGTGELIISKNRNGSLCDIPFRHNPSMTQFYDFDTRFGALEPNNEF